MLSLRQTARHPGWRRSIMSPLLSTEETHASSGFRNCDPDVWAKKPDRIVRVLSWNDSRKKRVRTRTCTNKHTQSDEKTNCSCFNANGRNKIYLTWRRTRSRQIKFICSFDETTKVKEWKQRVYLETFSLILWNVSFSCLQMTLHAWLMEKEKKCGDKMRRTYENTHMTTPVQCRWNIFHLIADVTEDASRLNKCQSGHSLCYHYHWMHKHNLGGGNWSDSGGNRWTNINVWFKPIAPLALNWLNS
jgi:hypothetical protein